jgi:DNA segregation ATPase FtsK/SpoIIIE-like protein
MTKATQTDTGSPNSTPNRLACLFAEARWFVLAVVTVYLILIFLTYSKLDPGWSQADAVPKLNNWGGRIGAYLADLLLYIFGVSAWWWCVLLVRSVWNGYRRLSQKFLPRQGSEREHHQGGMSRAAGFILLLTGSVAIEFLRMHSLKAQLPRAPGGVLGELIGNSAQTAFGFTGATLFSLVIFVVGFNLLFQVSWRAVAEWIGRALLYFHPPSRARAEEDARNKRAEDEARQQKQAHAASDTRTDEEILDVDPGFTFEDLKKTYREQCQRLHPDKWQTRPSKIRAMMEEEQKLVNAAYSRLKARFERT